MFIQEPRAIVVNRPKYASATKAPSKEDTAVIAERPFRSVAAVNVLKFISCVKKVIKFARAPKPARPSAASHPTRFIHQKSISLAFE